MRRRNKDKLTPAEELVLRIQQGDADAFFKLREQYRPYLDNFRGIFQNTLRLKDLRRKSIRRFAKRFIDKRQKRAINLVLYGWSLPEQPVVEEILKWLRASVYSADVEDMLAEIDLCFLECCMEYDPKKCDWDLYLFVRFQKRFVDYVRKWAVPVMFPTFDPMVVRYHENINVDTYRPEAEVDEYLGAGWIWGVSCSPTFAALSPFERWLLVERFVEKRKVSEIARRAGLSVKEAGERIRRAVSRLEESGRFWHTLNRYQAEETVHEASGPTD